MLVGLLTSRGGICRDRPRTGKFDLFGVLGEANAVSSLVVRKGSLSAGDGESVGFGTSDNDRAFVGEDLHGEEAIIPSGTSCVCFGTSSVRELPWDGIADKPTGTVVVDDMIRGIKHNRGFVSLHGGYMDLVLLSPVDLTMAVTKLLIALVLVSDGESEVLVTEIPALTKVGEVQLAYR